MSVAEEWFVLLESWNFPCFLLSRSLQLLMDKPLRKPSKTFNTTVFPVSFSRNCSKLSCHLPHMKILPFFSFIKLHSLCLLVSVPQLKNTNQNCCHLVPNSNGSTFKVTLLILTFKICILFCLHFNHCTNLKIITRFYTVPSI